MSPNCKKILNTFYEFFLAKTENLKQPILWHVKKEFLLDFEVLESSNDPRLLYTLFNSSQTVSEGYAIFLVLTVSTLLAAAAGFIYYGILGSGKKYNFVKKS